MANKLSKRESEILNSAAVWANANGMLDFVENNGFDALIEEYKKTDEYKNTFGSVDEQNTSEELKKKMASANWNQMTIHARIKDIVEQEIERLGANADLNHIDVSDVTNMGELFKNLKFNGDISQWDVSNVKNMSDMFYGSEFNGDISQWDVSNVKNMSDMFSYSKFNGDISKWDVSNVKYMNVMFQWSRFNGDLSKWNVSKVKDMEKMFSYSKFNGDLSNWDVSKVEDTGSMFADSPLEEKYGTNGENI